MSSCTCSPLQPHSPPVLWDQIIQWSLCTDFASCSINGYWAPSQYTKRRPFVRSRTVSKPWDLCLELSDRSEVWQAFRQHGWRCACQISKRYDNLKYQSGGFETSRDCTKRRLFGYWDGALMVNLSKYVGIYVWGSVIKSVTSNWIKPPPNFNSGFV